jgi:hypothetical protein
MRCSFRHRWPLREKGGTLVLFHLGNPPLVGHLARFRRGRLLAQVFGSRAQLMENTMADEFTFLGVAAGIGLVLLMILFI